MYNRYIPSEEYRPVEPPDHSQGRRDASSPLSGIFERLSSFLPGFGSGSNSDTKNAGGTGILGKLRLDKLDKGDILLVLILIYLYKESEDDEWLIILGLVLLMGL